MILYESEHVYVSLREGRSDFLLIAFGHFLFRGEPPHFWGEAVCHRGDLSGLGFVSRHGDWFPQEHMAPAIAAVLPQIERFARRLTFGGSMGGYGALKYSRALGAGVALALQPQYSIDPAVVGDFDHSFTQYFTPALKGMEIAAGDVAPRAYAFFDPAHGGDAGHVRLIARAAPQLRGLALPHVGHGVARALAGSAVALEMFSAALAGEDDRLRGVAQRARRRSGVRAGRLALDALVRHPAWGAAIAARHSERIEEQERGLLRTHLAGRLYAPDVAQRALDEAGRADARAFLSAFKPEPALMLREAAERMKLGDVEDALKQYKSLADLFPQFAPGLSQAARVFYGEGRLDEARLCWRRLVALDPGDDASWLWLSVAADRAGDGAEALSAAEASVAARPGNARAQDWLAGQLFKRDRLPEALAAAQEATRHEPQAAPYWTRLSRVADKAGELDLAIAAAREAARLAPGQTGALAFLSALLQRRGDFAEAQTHALGALAAAPERVDLLIRAAALALRLGEPVAGLGYARRALERDPGNPHALGLAAALERLIPSPAEPR